MNGDRRLVIGLLLSASFVVILNETIMSVALPVLMADLRVDASTVQWVSTGFLLTMAVVIPVSGWLQQRFTTRQVFLAAMGCFSAGTVVCGLAPGFGVLLAGRVVQACGTAVMIPLLMTTILVLIPLQRRGSVMGTVSIVISVAPALGPTISGVVLQYLGWRWMFWLVLPVAVLMLLLGAARMVDVGETRRVPVDLGSIALSAVGFGGLVYALAQVGQTSRGGPAVLVVSAVLSVLGLVGFVRRQLTLMRHREALLDLSVFRFRNFTVCVGVLMIGFAALLGAATLWPLMLQQVRGLNTVTTGLVLLPGGLMMGVMGPVVGRLYDRFGPRPLTVPAGVLMVAMLLVMSTADQQTPLGLLVLYHVLLSASLGFLFTPSFTHGLNDLTPALYAHGSAALGTLQQVSGAAGIALLISIMSTRFATLVAAGTPSRAAIGGGLTVSFLVAASLAVVAVVLTTQMRRSRPEVVV